MRGMIQSDQELAVARDRRSRLEHLLEQLRKTARPEEWPALSSGYRLEIERMQGEILDYLARASPGAKRTTTA
jgi:predicted O-methyltransferase YrrM